MPLANTRTSFGSVTKTFHWLTVLGILTVIPLGIVSNGLAHSIQDPTIPSTEADFARAFFLFSLHKTIGVTLFFVALARIFWALTQPRPGLLNAEKKLETFAAETVHWLLYGSLLLVPLTGWIHHASTVGFAPIWWPLGQSLPFVPKSQAVAETFASLHILFERVLLAAIFLHVAGALKHHVIDKDATLRRMLPGATDTPVPPAHGLSVLPPLAAVFVWVAVLSGAAVLGTFSSHAAQTPEAQLEAAPSGWEVQDGRLQIAYTQLGSPVTGEFADWSAVIEFEPRDTPGPAGIVEVTIAIPSLSIGTVTAQAMGPDFFDAETYPTATFLGDIALTDTGYEATGPLSIKGQSRDIILKFDIEIDGDTATMTGSTALQRLDFGVGQSMPDETSLKFLVEVSVSISARRSVDGQ